MKTFLAFLLALSVVCGAALAANPPAKGQCGIEVKAVVQDDQALVWCVKATTAEPAQFWIAGRDDNHGGWGSGSQTVPTKGKGSLCEGEVWIVASLIFPANEDVGYLQTIATVSGGKCQRMLEVNHGFKLTHQITPNLAGKSLPQNTAIELGTMGEVKLTIMVGEKSQEFGIQQTQLQNKSLKSN